MFKYYIIPNLARAVSIYFTARIFATQGDTLHSAIAYGVFGATMDFFKVDAAIYLLRGCKEKVWVKAIITIFVIIAVCISAMCTVGNAGYATAQVEAIKTKSSSAADIDASVAGLKASADLLMRNIESINKSQSWLRSREMSKLTKLQADIIELNSKKALLLQDSTAAYDMFDSISSILGISRTTAKNALRGFMAIILELFVVLAAYIYVKPISNVVSSNPTIDKINTNITVDTSTTTIDKELNVDNPTRTASNTVLSPADKKSAIIAENAKLLNISIDEYAMLKTAKGIADSMWSDIGKALRKSELYMLANQETKAVRFNTNNDFIINSKLKK